MDGEVWSGDAVRSKLRTHPATSSLSGIDVRRNRC